MSQDQPDPRNLKARKRKPPKGKCPTAAALSTNKVVTLEQKGVNTFRFQLGDVKTGANLRVWFYSKQNGNYPFIALKEPISGVPLANGDQIVLEIRPQKFNGNDMDVLLMLYDKNNKLKSYCGFRPSNYNFITDKIQIDGERIGSLNSISCMNTKPKPKASLSAQSAEDYVVPFEAIDLKNYSASNLSMVNSSEPLSFSAGRRLGGLGSTGENFNWAAGIGFLVVAAFAILAKLRIANKHRNTHGPT